MRFKTILCLSFIPFSLDLPAQETQKRFHLIGSTSFYYDSNVMQDHDGQDLDGFTNQNDTLLATALHFQYLLWNGARTDFLARASSDQSTDLNRVFDSNGFNFGRHGGGFEMRHRWTDKLQWSLPVAYAFTTLGRGKYVQSADFNSWLNFAWHPDWLTAFTAGVAIHDFFGAFANAAQDRDALEPAVQLEQYFFLPRNRKVYFKAGYGFARNVADGNDWDFNAHHLLFGLHAPLYHGVEFLLLEDWVRRDFSNTDSVFGATRTDNASTTTAVFSKEIKAPLTVAASYSFFVSDSNLTRFSYKRHIADFNVQAK